MDALMDLKRRAEWVCDHRDVHGDEWPISIPVPAPLALLLSNAVLSVASALKLSGEFDRVLEDNGNGSNGGSGGKK